MSEFFVQVIRLPKVGKHPNADNLSISQVCGDYPVIFKTGDFKEGDLAVYVPVDAVVPTDDPRFAFLGDHPRIRAKRLRGIFSMGLIVPADPSWTEGQNVQEELKIKRYEPPEPVYMGGENERDPGFLPVYTDIEGLRAHPDLLQEGEEVVLTEKVHGANGRAVFWEDRLWIGSHTCIKKQDPNNLWWKATAKYQLEEKLKEAPGLTVYFEVYGQVQDLKYGVPREEGLRIALFDTLDLKTRKYHDFDTFQAFAKGLELPTVPVLYRGPWSKDLVSHAEGNTMIGEGSNVREGFVVRPVVERFDNALGGRLILKRHGEGYLTRKGG